jgi:transcriptional regulator with XRE-family HTH domain
MALDYTSSGSYVPGVQGSRLERLLANGDISRAEIARALRLDPSTVSRKLSGKRSLKLQEIQTLLRFLSGRLARPVSYEELFAPDPQGRP